MLLLIVSSNEFCNSIKTLLLTDKRAARMTVPGIPRANPVPRLISAAGGVAHAAVWYKRWYCTGDGRDSRIALSVRRPHRHRWAVLHRATLHWWPHCTRMAILHRWPYCTGFRRAERGQFAAGGETVRPADGEVRRSACTVTAYIVMAYIVMAYIMAFVGSPICMTRQCRCARALVLGCHN